MQFLFSHPFLIGRFLEELQVYNKIEQSTEIPINPSPIILHSAPTNGEAHLLQLVNPFRYIIVTQSSQLGLRFTLGIVCSVGLEKWINTNTNHYGTIQTIFTALKIYALPLIHPHSPAPQLWATTDLFPVSTVCLFQKVIEMNFFIMYPFQISGFFHLLTCIQGSSVSFHGLMAPLFLVLNNTGPFLFWMDQSSFILPHVLQGALVTSKCWLL